MGLRTGPFVVMGMLHETGSDRVQLDISHRRPKVVIIEGGRIIPVVPEMSCHLAPVVDNARVLAMRYANCTGHRFIVLADNQEMHMVGH
jgi:hypothetical protein